MLIHLSDLVCLHHNISIHSRLGTSTQRRHHGADSRMRYIYFSSYNLRSFTTANNSQDCTSRKNRRPENQMSDSRVLCVVRRAVQVSQRSSEIGAGQNPWNGRNGGLKVWVVKCERLA